MYTLLFILSAFHLITFIILHDILTKLHKHLTETINFAHWNPEMITKHVMLSRDTQLMMIVIQIFAAVNTIIDLIMLVALVTNFE